MLSRPMLINRADCTFEMPTLALETNPGQPYQPSPLRHMKLHCQMCINMAEEIASVPSEKAGKELARGCGEWWIGGSPTSPPSTPSRIPKPGKMTSIIGLFSSAGTSTSLSTYFVRTP
jgi:hypothetical protein